MRKIVVLLSGGMDSTVLLYHYVKAGDQARAISFNYGQRHEKELFFARQNAAAVGVPITEVNLSALRDVLPGSSQTSYNIAVPEGKYDEESMKTTVVANRNAILLNVAIGHAIAYQMDAVAYAAHAGDHAVYPDCRPEFAGAIEKVAALCDWRKIEMLRPFIGLTKAHIANMGHNLGVQFQNTWSCYAGNALHCGRCGTCVERREAFYLARLADPTLYVTTAPTVEQLVAADWHPQLVGKNGNASQL